MYQDANVLRYHRIRDHPAINDFYNDCRVSMRENSGKGYKNPLNLDFHQVWQKHINQHKPDREQALCHLFKQFSCLNQWKHLTAKPAEEIGRLNKQKEDRILHNL